MSHFTQRITAIDYVEVGGSGVGRTWWNGGTRVYVMGGNIEIFKTLTEPNLFTRATEQFSTKLCSNQSPCFFQTKFNGKGVTTLSNFNNDFSYEKSVSFLSQRVYIMITCLFFKWLVI